MLLRKLLIVLALLVVAPVAYGQTCHAVGPSATGTGSGADFNNRMAFPASPVRGHTYYLIAGTYSGVQTISTAVSGTTQIHIWRATNADHGQTCSPSIATGYIDSSMGQPAGPAAIRFTYATSYLDIDGKYHPTPWQTNGGGLNVQTGYGFYTNGNTMCGAGECWLLNVSNSASTHDTTTKNLGMYGRGDSAVVDGGVTNIDIMIRDVDANGFASNNTFQYVGMFNSSNACVIIRGGSGITFDHVWCEHTHSTPNSHSEPISLSGNNNLTVSNSVFKDVEGTGGIVNLGYAGPTDGALIYGNIFFTQPGNPTGRGAWGNGVISCINGQTWTNVKYLNNTVANMIGSTRIYMINDATDCLDSTGLLVKNNLWYNNGNGTLDVSPFVATAQCAGFDYNSYLKNTATTCDTGSQKISLAGAANPFVNTTQQLPSDYQLSSNTNATPWLNTNAIVSGNSVDMLNVARVQSRGTFEFVSGSVVPPSAPTGLTGNVSGSTVNLSWTASTGSPIPTAYTLYRGSVHGGPYTISKSGLGLSTTDTPPNGTWFYVVTAYVGGIVTSISANGTTGTVTCNTACLFPAGRAFTIGGNSNASFNTTFTSTGQPTNSTFTFNTSINSTGTGGGVWATGAESVKSNEVQFTVPAALTVTLLPASRTFASTTVGTSSTSQTHTLTNTSGAGGTVTITAKGFSGANPGDYSETDNCPSLLMSGLSCTFNITFRPTAAGTRTANLTVADNASGSPQTVALTGTGVTGTPSVSLSPSPLNFGDQSVSTTSSVRTVTVSNAVGGPVGFDQYGGRTDITCTVTGFFHTQKIGTRWWMCTPLGHAFYSQMMNGVTPDVDATLSAKVISKYGSNAAWATQTNRQLQAWNFNTLTSHAYGNSIPIGTDPSYPLDSNGIHSQPVKLPFTQEVRPALYSMQNPPMGGTPFLTNPVKNLMYAHSSFYPGFVPGNGIADYYDSGLATWLQSDLNATSAQDFTMNALRTSPYQNYLLGFMTDDGDQMFGFGAGPDFTTQPAGHNSSNLGLLVATMSPVQTANAVIAYGGGGYVYNNKQVYSKLALRNNLATQYGTIGAMNTAWGSTYTTFDSSGVCVGSQPITCASSVAANSVGTGNGSTLVFSTTLSNATISRYSLQILVAGTPVAGDIGDGTLYGRNASGTINYTTKALSITFTAGNAPANGAAITATYVANGWEIGTGFLDEDNRVAHNGYLGTDWIALSSADPDVKTDLNTFLKAIAGRYFSDCTTQIHVVYPNIPNFGPDSLSTWGVPSPAPVLQAAALYLDAFVTASDVLFTQAEMDFIETNFGDKPYFGSFYASSNPDSALSAFPNNPSPVGFATQAARGSAYSTMVTGQIQTSKTTAGNFPYIGTYWWTYYDSWGEHLNWGLVTHLDNAYDAHDPATGTVTCSAPLAAFNCGGEPVPSGGGVPPFGNLITPVISANALWTQSGGGGTAPQVLATPYFTITGTNSADFANAATGTCANGLSIAPGSSCTVNLTFTPSAAGARTANLNIFGTVNIVDILNGNGITTKCQITGNVTLSGVGSVCQ